MRETGLPPILARLALGVGLLMIAPSLSEAALPSGEVERTARSMRVTVSFVEDEWVGVRYDVSPGHDLRAWWAGHMCTKHTRLTLTSFKDVDGKITSLSGFSGPRVGGESAAIGAVHTPGTHTEIFLGGAMPSGHCFPYDDGYASSGTPANDYVTLIAPGIRSYGTATFEATWTTGVDGWEVVRGRTISAYKDELIGVAAGTYIFLPASATVAWHTVDTKGRVAGYWWPHVGPGPDTAICLQNGEACPYGPAFVGYWVKSEGPTHWSFIIPGSVDLANEIALALIEIE